MSEIQPIYRPREYISLSTLVSFIRCPRRYFYQKCGIASHDEPAALHYGTAMHRAISVAAMEGLEPAMVAFASVWDESLADNKRSLKRARDQLTYFVLTHKGSKSLYKFLPPPTSDVKLEEDTSPYEIPFVIDVGLPVPIAGRLDGWVEHRDTKKRYAYEFKTTSRLTSSLFDSLELNPQLLTYALVVRTVTGQPIEGVMFEAMLIDPKKVDNLTHPQSIADHHLDDIVVWLRYYGAHLLDCERRYAEALVKGGDPQDPANFFPKNFAGCSSYPHFYIPGSQCEFSNLCRVERWQNMLPYYSIKPEHKLIELSISAPPTKV